MGSPRWPIAVPALLATSPAAAFEASFHSYGGFQETVDAFRAVSLIFSDSRYETLVILMATVGIGLGALLASARGSGMGLVAFGFQILVGVGLFIGMVATTGTVHIYDRVKNAYAAVGDVPVLLILVAGTTNMIERAMVETIDDNSIDPNTKYAFNGGGHAFDLFLNAVASPRMLADSHLDATLRDYVRQCYPVARVSPAYAIDDDKLFRTAIDLPTAFAAMAGPSTFATVYSSANKGGTTMSCEEAWNHISTRLSDPELFVTQTKRACRATGFLFDSPPQKTRCTEQLGALGNLIFQRPISAHSLFTHVLLSRTVGDVLLEDSPAAAARVMANRAILTNGYSGMAVANDWIPKVRATVFAVMLFMVPVALLFILTPINLRVASFTLGLFVFVALWGVIDAGIHQFALGSASAAIQELSTQAFGVETWLAAPDAASKALAVFGSLRTAAAGIAGAFVFTVFRFSGNVFGAFTGSALGVTGQATAAAAPIATSEGHAAALERQASAMGTRNRVAAATGFGDFGERSSFSATRSFGEAGTLLGRHPSAGGDTALALGTLDAARQIGGLSPALKGRGLADPQVARALEANAATSAIHQFAEKDALRTLGTSYFGQGEAGERAFAAFAQNLVQWRAFGDQRAYDMMLQGAQRHFERRGYSPKDAALKASGVVSEAQSDPLFAKLVANSFDQERLLRNDLTQAQIAAGAMEGRRDSAGDHVMQTERANVATEQALRTGSNQGQRDAADMLGLRPEDTAQHIALINALSGEARFSAIAQLGQATGRNEAQVTKAIETYNAATSLGTADGATAQARREGRSVYARTKEAAGYDFAERSGKLDAQREVGTSGTRAAARIGEQRRQADNFGFAEGAAAAGTSTREAARLDSFIRTLSQTAGNQIDMASGGAAGITDRARNERTTRMVENERLSRIQGLLRANGVAMSKRDLALAQNGDLSLNVSPKQAEQLHRAGLINVSQFGAIAQGGQAHFSLANNDVLVSTATSFRQSGRYDSSTRFEAGKQAGPDSIEHFMGGGEAGQKALAAWLQGGFRMDRTGEWRIAPQVADTLQRDIGAILAQTGWQRSLTRTADKQSIMSSNFGVSVGASMSAGGGSDGSARGSETARNRSSLGRAGGQIGFESRDSGMAGSSARSSLDIVNYDVRSAIAAAEGVAAKSREPAAAFSRELSRQILGADGLRAKYLQDAASGRGTWDFTAPLTSMEQSSVLATGRHATDLDHGPGDGEPKHRAQKD